MPPLNRASVIVVEQSQNIILLRTPKETITAVIDKFNRESNVIHSIVVLERGNTISIPVNREGDLFLHRIFLQYYCISSSTILMPVAAQK